MSLITDIDAIIDLELPDNNSEDIAPANLRTALKAISARLGQLVPLYLRVNLVEADDYTHNALQVATSRLMIISAGTVISNGPVNDDPDPDPANWPYPGGATPTSWSHDEATGKVLFPMPTDTIEIFIRPII